METAPFGKDGVDRGVGGLEVTLLPGVLDGPAGRGEVVGAERQACPLQAMRGDAKGRGVVGLPSGENALDRSGHRVDERIEEFLGELGIIVATLDQALYFNLYMAKAIMDGRASELIDLARTNLRI